jgi:hypothetical protein
VLYKRRYYEKQQSNAEVMARDRDHQNERNRQQKINAGYVMLIVVLLKNIVCIVSLQARFLHAQLSCAHTVVYSLESACI